VGGLLAGGKRSAISARERIVEPAPCACGKCGSARLHKLGEVVSKTLECEPRRWKIIERVREKFSCRDCEAITEEPAPSHPIPRGFAGPSLLAMVLVNKFLLHQPLASGGSRTCWSPTSSCRDGSTAGRSRTLS
jgi:transposase